MTIEKRKKIRMIFITILLVFVFVIVISEILLRIFWNGLMPPPEKEAPFPFIENQYDDVNYTLRPDIHYRYIGKNINKLGFRFPDSITKEKKPGTYRVVVLGDSVVFGLRTSEEDTISAVLEDRLNSIDLSGGRRAEVINFGGPGYNMTQYCAVLKRYAKQYNPDLIIIGITFYNDLDGYTNKYIGNGYISPVPVSDVNGYNYKLDAPSFLVWNSYLLRRIYYLSAPKRDELVEPYKKHGIPQLWGSCDRKDDIWDETEELIDDISMNSAEIGAEVIYAFFPAEQQVRYPEVPETTQKIFSELLEKRNIKYIDFTKDFQDYYRISGHRPFRDSDSHPDNTMFDHISSSIRDEVLFNSNHSIRDNFNGVINIGHEDDKNYLSFGWGRRWKYNKRFRWVIGVHARLIFPEFKKEINSLSIGAKSFDGCKGQILSVSVNGREIEDIKIENFAYFKKRIIRFKSPLKLERINRIDFRVSCAVKQPKPKATTTTPVLYSAAISEVELR